MSCGEAIELISALLDGELGVSDTIRLQHHLGDCEACRAAQASEMWLHALLAAGALSEQPPDFLRPRSRSTSHARPHRHCAGARHGGAARSFSPSSSGALSVVAVLILLVHLPGGGLSESPVLTDAVAEHRRYSDAGIAICSASPSPTSPARAVGRLPGWASRSSFRPAPRAARRPWALASSPWPGAPPPSSLYGRWTPHLALRGPEAVRPLPEEGEHIIDGREVYTSALGASNVGWWEDRRHLYLVVSSAGPEDLLALAELCMRSQRSRQARPPVPM